MIFLKWLWLRFVVWVHEDALRSRVEEYEASVGSGYWPDANIVAERANLARDRVTLMLHTADLRMVESQIRAWWRAKTH